MREEWVTVAIAARKTGVTVRTVRAWIAEGLTVKRQGRAILVHLPSAFAYRRWKSLNNPVMEQRRQNAAKAGTPTAQVSQKNRTQAYQDYIAASHNKTT